MRIHFMGHHMAGNVPLYVGLLGGLCGILVDTDHIIAYYMLGINPAIQTLRIFHPQIFTVSGAIIISLCTYIAGLYLRAILIRREHKNEV